MIKHADVQKAEHEGWRGEPFILTYTGKKFPYSDVTTDCIDIRDIAHSLSQLCRYTGHTNLFYSVAQHSLLVSEKMPGGPAEKLVGLLHDGAEAYTNDLASPLKKWLNNPMGEAIQGPCRYGRLQNTITTVIYNKYGVTEIPGDVKMFDTAAGLYEAEGFMGLSEEELARYSFPMHLRHLWQPWDPHVFAEANSDLEMSQVETLFLERFENLMDQLGRLH